MDEVKIDECFVANQTAVLTEHNDVLKNWQTVAKYLEHHIRDIARLEEAHGKEQLKCSRLPKISQGCPSEMFEIYMLCSNDLGASAMDLSYHLLELAATINEYSAKLKDAIKPLKDDMLPSVVEALAGVEAEMSQVEKTKAALIEMELQHNRAVDSINKCKEKSVAHEKYDSKVKKTAATIDAIHIELNKCFARHWEMYTMYIDRRNLLHKKVSEVEAYAADMMDGFISSYCSLRMFGASDALLTKCQKDSKIIRDSTTNKVTIDVPASLPRKKSGEQSDGQDSGAPAPSQATLAQGGDDDRHCIAEPASDAVKRAAYSFVSRRKSTRLARNIAAKSMCDDENCEDAARQHGLQFPRRSRSREPSKDGPKAKDSKEKEPSKSKDPTTPTNPDAPAMDSPKTVAVSVVDSEPSDTAYNSSSRKSRSTVRRKLKKMNDLLRPAARSKTTNAKSSTSDAEATEGNSSTTMVDDEGFSYQPEARDVVREVFSSVSDGGSDADTPQIVKGFKSLRIKPSNSREAEDGEAQEQTLCRAAHSLRLKRGPKSRSGEPQDDSMHRQESEEGSGNRKLGRTASFDQIVPSQSWHVPNNTAMPFSYTGGRGAFSEEEGSVAAASAPPRSTVSSKLSMSSMDADDGILPLGTMREKSATWTEQDSVKSNDNSNNLSTVTQPHLETVNSNVSTKSPWISSQESVEEEHAGAVDFSFSATSFSQEIAGMSTPTDAFPAAQYLFERGTGDSKQTSEQKQGLDQLPSPISKQQEQAEAALAHSSAAESCDTPEMMILQNGVEAETSQEDACPITHDTEQGESVSTPPQQTQPLEARLSRGAPLRDSDELAGSDSVDANVVGQEQSADSSTPLANTSACSTEDARLGDTSACVPGEEDEGNVLEKASEEALESVDAQESECDCQQPASEGSATLNNTELQSLDSMSETNGTPTESENENDIVRISAINAGGLPGRIEFAMLNDRKRTLSLQSGVSPGGKTSESRAQFATSGRRNGSLDSGSGSGDGRVPVLEFVEVVDAVRVRNKADVTGRVEGCVNIDIPTDILFSQGDLSVEMFQLAGCRSVSNLTFNSFTSTRTSGDELKVNLKKLVQKMSRNGSDDMASAHGRMLNLAQYDIDLRNTDALPMRITTQQKVTVPGMVAVNVLYLHNPRSQVQRDVCDLKIMLAVPEECTLEHTWPNASWSSERRTLLWEVGTLHGKCQSAQGRLGSCDQGLMVKPFTLQCTAQLPDGAAPVEDLKWVVTYQYHTEGTLVSKLDADFLTGTPDGAIDVKKRVIVQGEVPVAALQIVDA